jgi:hypothetical protein
MSAKLWKVSEIPRLSHLALTRTSKISISTLVMYAMVLTHSPSATLVGSSKTWREVLWVKSGDCECVLVDSQRFTRTSERIEIMLTGFNVSTIAHGVIVFYGGMSLSMSKYK